jgi:hypothetical protein
MAEQKNDYSGKPWTEAACVVVGTNKYVNVASLRQLEASRSKNKTKNPGVISWCSPAGPTNTPQSMYPRSSSQTNKHTKGQSCVPERLSEKFFSHFPKRKIVTRSLLNQISVNKLL